MENALKYVENGIGPQKKNQPCQFVRESKAHAQETLSLTGSHTLPMKVLPESDERG